MTQFDPSMLPPQPDIIPDELRALSADNTAAGWQQRVPPQAVGMFVAAVVRWLSDPRFGVRVDVETREDGWTLNIGLPQQETREDVVLPDTTNNPG